MYGRICGRWPGKLPWYIHDHVAAVHSSYVYIVILYLLTGVLALVLPTAFGVIAVLVVVVVIIIIFLLKATARNNLKVVPKEKNHRL